MEEHKKHHKKKKTLSNSFYIKLYIALGILLILIVLYNSLQASSFSNLFEQKIDEAKKAAIPAKIELTIISTPSCEECYDINSAVEVLESTGVNITSKKEVEYSDAKSLIEKYDIEKVPTVIIGGEINKSRSLMNILNDNAEKKKGDYIFVSLIPPFIETSSEQVRGKISLIYLNNNECKECSDLRPFVDQLSKSGLKFEKREEIDVDSARGRNLVKKYDIKKIPIIIMDKEVEVYTEIIGDLIKLGSVESDGAFVMRLVNPPYYSTEEEKIKGLITITFLDDKTCADCYEPSNFHKPILQNMGVVFKSEESLDITSSRGKALIDKYDIEKVPTILLEGDVEEYPVLVRAWAEVGTVESNGVYVFRKVEVVQQPYKDLSTNEIVE